MIRVEIWATRPNGARVQVFAPQWTHRSNLRPLIQSYRRARYTSIYPVRCK